MVKKSWFHFTGLLLLLVLFTGCGSPSATPEPTPLPPAPPPQLQPTPTLAPTDVPVFVCWEDLTPEQKHLTTTINCTDEAPPLGSASSQPTRIEFEPGAVSGSVSGTLPAGGMAQYVLWAMAGQEMQVNLTGVSSDEALLVIWGKDGTVLISDHATTQSWQGELPVTQDYFIDVRASAMADTVAFTLEVIILPQ